MSPEELDEYTPFMFVDICHSPFEQGLLVEGLYGPGGLLDLGATQSDFGTWMENYIRVYSEDNPHPWGK